MVTHNLEDTAVGEQGATQSEYHHQGIEQVEDQRRLRPDQGDTSCDAGDPYGDQNDHYPLDRHRSVVAEVKTERDQSIDADCRNGQKWDGPRRTAHDR